jgi:hypothetical protein
VSNFLDNEFGFSSLGGGGGGGGEGDITGSGFVDEVAFFNDVQSITGENQLFFRNSLVRLSIGDSAVATQTLDVTGTTKATSFTIVNGGTFTTPAAGSINISSNLGIGVAVGSNPTQKLDVEGSMTISSDLFANHIDGFSTFLNEIFSIGVTNTPIANSLTINSRSAIIFGEGSGTLGGSQTMLLYDTGNVVIQNGGVFTDTGERLKVVGNVLVSGSNLVTTNSTNVLRGSGTTGGTTTLTLNQLGGTALYRFRNDNRLYYGSQGNNAPHITISAIAGVNILFRAAGNLLVDQSNGVYSFTTEESMTQTSGIANGVVMDIDFAPTSGTSLVHMLQVATSINQTGGANGISRALYINPTLTSAADFRAIETNVNIGGTTRYQAFFNGTAPIFFKDGANLQFETGTGTKFGIATNNRLSFWNATPIAQPTAAGTTAATYVAVGGGVIQTNDTFDAYTFAQLVRALRLIGFLA